MKKTAKALLALVMAAVMLLSAIPASAAETRSVATNFNAVVNHINSDPNAYTEEDGYKSLSFYVEEDGGEVLWYLWNQSNGIKFGTIMVATQGSEVMYMQLEFLLRKNYTTVNTDLYVRLGETNQDYYYDGLDVSKSFNRTTITASSEYTGFSESTYGYISAEEIQDIYNASLQSVCLFWNTYFLGALGFGMDGLGFTKYQCPHTYTNDCDAQCDLCGQTTRETEHSFGSWVMADEDNHSKTCSVCSEKETEAHKWSVREIVKMPAPEENGTITYVCKDCGGEKTVEVVYKPGDLEVDGFVDNKDVEYLLWHTLYPEDYPLPQDADYNGDGYVDNQDVEYLLWHTLYPEDFPLV